MKVKELKKLVVNATSRYVTREEAEYFADEIIETDIRKPPHKKFGDDMIADLRSWSGKSANITKQIDLPAFTQYDFASLGPSLKIKEIHDELERKANANGIAMVSIVNSGGMHTMHLWTQGLAKRGLFALGAWNGGPDAVVPHNGTKGLLGTNPMTYGFPGDKGDIVVDMATSDIPYFKIVGAKKSDTPLPLGVAVDSSGIVTTDPSRALDEAGVSNLLPIGGNYKGYNLNYLIEIMTSALIGTRASSEMSDKYVEVEHGGFIVAIAINKVTSKEKYDSSVKSLNEEIRSQKPKAGVESVKVPGDNNLKKLFDTSEETDIEISEEYVKVLTDLAAMPVVSNPSSTSA